MAIKGDLKEVHRAACRLRVEGKDNDFIAKELGVKKRTLYVWFSDPKIKKEITRLLETIDQIFTEKMAMLGNVAIDALAEIIAEGHDGKVSVGQRLNAIEQAMDRVSETTARIPEDKPGPNTNVNIGMFSEMTDQQLVAQARQLAPDVLKEAETLEGTAVESTSASQ